MRQSLLVIAILALVVAAIPAAASPIYGSGTYAVSGTLDNQSLTGTVTWSGTKVTGYKVTFDGETFTCSSKSGACSVFLKSFKIAGGTETLAGLFTPGGSPFSLTVKVKHNDPTYWGNLSWSYVGVSEESSLAQAACLLGLLALAIPWAGRLRTQKA